MSAGSVTCMIIWPLRAFSGTPLTSMLTQSSLMVCPYAATAAGTPAGGAPSTSERPLCSIMY